MQKIKQWIETHARPLDLAFYEYIHHKGFKSTVIKALEKYQNADGGFAHGIEPDNLNPNSSAIQTAFAIEYIKQINLEDNHPMIKNTVKYLLDTLPDDGLYPAVVASNEDYPHAIWWDYHEGECIWGYNPSVALWAFIYKHHKQLSIKKLLVRAFMSFVNQPTNDMHELKSFVDAYEFLYDLRDEFLTFPIFEKILKKQLIETASMYNGYEREYKATPLTFCSHPKQHVFDILKPMIDIELKDLIKALEEYDIWPIYFNWQQYPKSYEEAKIIWQSINAIKYLNFLSL